MSFLSLVACLWIQQTDFSYSMSLFVKPKAKDKDDFSPWKDLILGGPQGPSTFAFRRVPE